MTDELPPLPAHPVARAYDRSGAPMPNRGWTDSEAAAMRAYAAAAVARERERIVDIVLIELDCNGQAGAIIAAIREGE